jgi:hypothetical protein
MEYVLIQPNQGIVFPSVTYVRNLITKAGTKQVTLLFSICLLFVSCTATKMPFM